MQNDECKIVVSPSEMDFDFMSEGHTIILHFAFYILHLYNSSFLIPNS